MLVSAIKNNVKKINFGTNERTIHRKLDSQGQNIKNCCYFFRPSSDNPFKVADCLVEAAASAKKVEWKIWGVADLSSFLTQSILLRKKMGESQYKKVFSNVDLVDVDPEIIARAKSGIVGMTQEDKSDLLSLGINPEEYFEKTSGNYFLSGEPKVIGRRRDEIQFHSIKKYLLDDTTIRVGDIRADAKALSEPQDGHRRIFEFANGWHFMHQYHQVELASNLSKKMGKGDVMIIGRCETKIGIHKILDLLGFEKMQNMTKLLIKKR